jgi:hypothetical protein
MGREARMPTAMTYTAGSKSVDAGYGLLSEFIGRTRVRSYVRANARFKRGCCGPEPLFWAYDLHWSR